MYRCETCGDEVRGLAAARKHAKQGHKTQREAFQVGQLHTLALVVAEKAPAERPDDYDFGVCEDCPPGEVRLLADDKCRIHSSATRKRV